jgi:hypothetical protein
MAGSLESVPQKAERDLLQVRATCFGQRRILLPRLRLMA